MTTEPEQPAGPADHERTDDGLDLARTLARATARSTPGRKKAVRRVDRSARTGRVSGAHPDDRDPQTLDTALTRMVDDHGWQVDLQGRTAIFARWADLVGARGRRAQPGRVVRRRPARGPHRLDRRGRPSCGCSHPTVVRRLNEELGHGTVLVIEVLGPHAPSWKHGPRSRP